MWQESGSRKISRNLLLSTLITQRTMSRSRNTALGNIFTLPTFLNVLRMFQTEGCVVNRKFYGKLDMPSLKTVSAISLKVSNSVTELALRISVRRRLQECCLHTERVTIQPG